MHFTALKKEIIEHLGTEITDLQKKLAGKYYEDLKWELVRDMMVDKRIRLDGRKLDQVRPLAMEVDPLTNSAWFFFIYKRRNSIFNNSYFRYQVG